MPEHGDYEHGVPSWVDLASHDLTAAVGFYSELFGWDAFDTGDSTSHYTMMSKNGKLVAALSQAQDPAPARWTTYVSVDELSEVASKVPAAGGDVLFGPMEVMTAGKMAIFRDRTGAVIAAWQPGAHRGAQLVNEAGAFTWSELSSSDVGASKAFYTAVFGWGWGGDDAYAQARVGGESIAGVMPRPDSMPAGVPDSWLVYFGIAEIEAGTERAAGLGATVAVAPTAIPGMGRFSVLLDREGAAFALYG